MICELRRIQIESLRGELCCSWLPESLHSRHDFSNRSRIILEPLHSWIMNSRLRNVLVTVLRPAILESRVAISPGISRIPGISILSVNSSFSRRDFQRSVSAISTRCLDLFSDILRIHVLRTSTYPCRFLFTLLILTIHYWFYNTFQINQRNFNSNTIKIFIIKYEKDF